MKSKFSLMSLLLLLVVLTANAGAQEQTSAVETSEKLRLQLIDVQAREEALRIREQQLEEALKPENIERALAGVGSTRPEELRESRRRQLAIERDSVQKQLQVFETTRSHLESAIVDADAQAYQQSARPFPSISNQMLIAQYLQGSRWLVLAGIGLVAMALVGGALLVRSRL
jgi:membrane-bound lytic murein transglycosylase B